MKFSWQVLALMLLAGAWLGLAGAASSSSRVVQLDSSQENKIAHGVVKDSDPATALVSVNAGYRFWTAISLEPADGSVQLKPADIKRDLGGVWASGGLLPPNGTASWQGDFSGPEASSQAVYVHYAIAGSHGPLAVSGSLAALSGTVLMIVMDVLQVDLIASGSAVIEAIDLIMTIPDITELAQALDRNDLWAATEHMASLVLQEENAKVIIEALGKVGVKVSSAALKKVATVAGLLSVVRTMRDIVDAGIGGHTAGYARFFVDGEPISPTGRRSTAPTTQTFRIAQFWDGRTCPGEASQIDFEAINFIRDTLSDARTLNPTYYPDHPLVIEFADLTSDGAAEALVTVPTAFGASRFLYDFYIIDNECSVLAEYTEQFSGDVQFFADTPYLVRRVAGLESFDEPNFPSRFRYVRMEWSGSEFLDTSEMTLSCRDAAGELVGELCDYPRHIDLCPGEGDLRAGDVQQSADLDRDGALELLTIQFDSSQHMATLAVSALSGPSAAYQVVAQKVFRASDIAAAGPWGSAWHGDLTGDGRDEAVLCVRQWGANDQYTYAAIFSYANGSGSSLFVDKPFYNGGLSWSGSQLLTVDDINGIADGSVCRSITTSYFAWDGAQFGFVRDETRNLSEDGAACS